MAQLKFILCASQLNEKEWIKQLGNLEEIR